MSVILAIVVFIVAAQSTWGNRFRFDLFFDRNLAGRPVASSIASFDRSFRNRVLHGWQGAFAEGGWHLTDLATNEILKEDEPEISWVELHADDALLVAGWRAYLAEMQALRYAPEWCRGYVSTATDPGPDLPMGLRSNDPAADATADIYRSGAANLKGSKPLKLPSWSEAAASREKVLSTASLTKDEEQALSAPNEAAADVRCDAVTKFFQAVVALPEAEAAAVIRGELRRRATRSFWWATQRDRSPGPVGEPVGRYKEQIWWVPVALEPGRSETLLLQTWVYRPDGPGPFPLVTINHGNPFKGDERRKYGRGFVNAAHWFVEKGFAVAVPLRRGFGGSQGEYDDYYLWNCAKERYIEGARRAARDIGGAIEYMRQQTFVDASHVVVVGISAGGLATLALAETPPPGVSAIVNVAGGVHSSRSDEACQSDAGLVEAVGTLDRKGAVPQLWLYAENDKLFSPRVARAMFEAYRVRSSTTLRFSLLPPQGADGHNMFVDVLAAWAPEMERFLGQSFPTSAPPPTRASDTIAGPPGKDS